MVFVTGRLSEEVTITHREATFAFDAARGSSVNNTFDNVKRKITTVVSPRRFLDDSDVASDALISDVEHVILS